MAKVLIVSSAFPPVGSAGGTMRLVKFIKFLSIQGWDFTVFTQDPSRMIANEQILSDFLLEELPANLVIERIPAPFSHTDTDPSIPSSSLHKRLGYIFRKIFGDSALPWGILVFWKGLKAIRQKKIDIVFSTSPPFTNAFIGSLISLVSGKPFVFDLRDDWVGSPVFLLKDKFRQSIEILLEKFVIWRAASVITVTSQSLRLYQDRYASINRKNKFQLVPNGCDLDEYDHLENREKRIVSEKFLILSAAWWYRKGHRDLTPFLLALNIFFARRTDARQKVSVVMLGNSLSPEYEKLLVDLNLNDAIQRLGSVHGEELIEWLWKADLFLLVQPEKNTTAISGTLYEYWAAGKAPILLIAEKGASSELVEDHQLGCQFHFDQIDQIADYIERNFDAYLKGTPVWIQRTGVENFDRKYLAKQMAEIWQSLISNSNGSR